MYTNKTWGEIFRMLRKKAEELGRAPEHTDIPCSLDLINGLKHGGWSFVLGHAGIYYRGDRSKETRFPLFLEDFTDEQLISVIRRIAWKNKHLPREKDVWCYIECIYRWGSWEETLNACGMNVPNTYKPKNPLPAPVENFHKYAWRKIRRLDYRDRNVRKAEKNF